MASSPFEAGDLVISVYGDGDGSGTYTDNQGSPITLEDLSTSGTVNGTLVLPQTASGANNTISGEYGSSSEGSLQLSTDGESLVIAGYNVNAAAFNSAEAGYQPTNTTTASTKTAGGTYGTGALAQTTSVPGGQSTVVPRVIADINYNGTVDTSTSLINVDNENNPRSVATANGSSFYLSGQGVKGDTTQGVFLATDGQNGTTPTAIYTGVDTRTAELYNNTLYVSEDSSQAKGTGGIYTFGSVPTAQTTPTALPGLSGSVTLAAGQGNSVNNSTGTVDLSPENFFFANANTLYVADSGNPKGGTAGDGGLQKWSFNTASHPNVWSLDYTLSQGLNLVSNSTALPSGNGTGYGTNATTGLIGLTGKVNAGGTVSLYATNATVGDLNNTYLYGITDQLSATTAPTNESFATLATAAPDTNIRGVAFAPVACYGRGTLIRTAEGDRPVETLAIGDDIVTVSGDLRAVKWIGHRAYSGRFARANPDVLPIRFAAGSIEDGVPHRELVVSPKHAMFIDGMLIPAECLVNGTTVERLADVLEVSYWHVELSSHDVLIAEGAASESYVDDNNRGMFLNASEYVALYGADAPEDARYCAPRVEDGYRLEAVRARLGARATRVAAVEEKSPWVTAA